MENYVNDAAVIPYSVFESIEMLPNDTDKALAYRTLISNNLKDEFNLTGNSMIDIILTMARPNQISSAQRYKKAIENGAKGGRPPTVDRKQVITLRESGYTQNQIAEEVGCSIRTVRNILAKQEKIQPAITGNNLEIEIEKEKEKEKEIEKENETEKKNKIELELENSDFVPF